MARYLDVRPGVKQPWIILARDDRPDLYIGPWLSEADGLHALNNSLLVDSECEDGCTDCYLDIETAPNLDHGDDVCIVDQDDPDHTGRPATTSTDTKEA